MSLFNNSPVDPINIIQNDNFILKLGKVYNLKSQPRQLVYAVFDGILTYNSANKVACLDSKQGFKAYYGNVSQIQKSLLETNIEANTIIGISQPVIQGIRELEYLEFWLEYEGEQIDSVPFLYCEDKEQEEEEVQVTKPIKMKGNVDHYHLIENDGNLYIKLEDLAPIANIKHDEDGVISLVINRKKEGKK